MLNRDICGECIIRQSWRDIPDSDLCWTRSHWTCYIRAISKDYRPISKNDSPPAKCTKLFEQLIYDTQRRGTDRKEVV